MLDNVDAALESAISSHEAGDLLVAGEKYLEILKADPSHPDANHNLGVLSVNINNPVISGVGNEPAVVGYAMGVNKDITSAAIIGNSGVFYIYVTDRRKASSLANYQNMINIISSTRSSNVRNKAYDALKEKAEIEDFRGTFY